MAADRMITVRSLQDQLTDLKAEILELSGALASNADAAKTRAAPTFKSARDGIRDIAHGATGQGRAAIDAIRQNPGTTTSVAATAGLIGLAIGYMLGASSSSGAFRGRF